MTEKFVPTYNDRSGIQLACRIGINEYFIKQYKDRKKS